MKSNKGNNKYYRNMNSINSLVSIAAFSTSVVFFKNINKKSYYANNKKNNENDISRLRELTSFSDMKKHSPYYTNNNSNHKLRKLLSYILAISCCAYRFNISHVNEYICV